MYVCVVFSDEFVTSEIRESLCNLSFDNWPWTDAQMIILLHEMFTGLDLLSKCCIDVCIKQDLLIKYSCPSLTVYRVAFYVQTICEFGIVTF